MRITITVDDRLGEAALSRARQEGISLSAFVAKALEAHLMRPPKTEAPPFRLVTVGGGGPQPGLDLGQTSELLVAEDERDDGPASDRIGSRARR